MFDVELLGERDAEEFEGLVRRSSTGMLYHSPQYRDLLDDFIKDARPLYLIAKQGGRMVGALPSFLKVNDTLGNILNSLPFFGSIGGFIVDGELPVDLRREIRRSLLEGFDDLAKANECILSTIITSPFDKDSGLYDEITPDFSDTRICQIVSLPAHEEGFRERLLSLYESSGRRNVRRAQRSGVTVSAQTTVESIRELFKLHSENISAKGGIVKPQSFFMSIFDHFSPDDDFRVYVARKNGAVVAVLLLFYHDGVVEYYTPATRVEFRDLQAMPLVIFSAMADAIERGYRYWNFGGTWHTQEALYRFKKKWGAADYPYRYIIRRHADVEHILGVSPEKLGEEYRWFYAVPHSELRGRT